MEPLRGDDPRFVGAYRLLGRLGAGGMGQVFLGESPGGRKVAVKVLLPQHAADAEFRQRFSREVAAARQVGGFHTASVVDAAPDADPPWMVTAYIPGPSLDAAVRQNGPLEPGEVRRLGAGLAEGLAAVHTCGLVHRDLKPSNIILADDGPRIIDFGIARPENATALTSAGVVIGTFSFMSPEQVRGEMVDSRSDIFSLGSVLAYTATGRGPFDAATIPAIVHRIANEPPDLLGISGPLREIIGTCLAKDPASRPSLSGLMALLAAPAPPGAVADGEGAGRTPTAFSAPSTATISSPGVRGQPTAPDQDPGAQTDPPARHPGRSRKTLVSVITAICLAGVTAVALTTSLIGNGPSGSHPGMADTSSTHGGNSTTVDSGGNTKTCAYTSTGDASRPVSLPPAKTNPAVVYTAVLRTNRGNIAIKLRNSQAPCTVNSFVHLAEAGFWDNTQCHRLSTSGGLYMLQCGDPTAAGSQTLSCSSSTLGTGNPGYTFADENLSGATYGAGTVAMANSGGNTNGSQFFLVYKNTSLPPDYTPFGTITSGLGILQNVANAGTSCEYAGAGGGVPREKVIIDRVTVTKA